MTDEKLPLYFTDQSGREIELDPDDTGEYGWEPDHDCNEHDGERCV